MTQEGNVPPRDEAVRRPVYGEAKIDLRHPAYLAYQDECRRLRQKAEQNSWSLDDIRPLLAVDAASYADIPEGKRQSFLFMASHRLQAEFRVARQLGPFLAAVPDDDIETQIMLSLQMAEEYKHTDGQRNFYHDVMAVTDFAEMIRVAEDNTDFVSRTLYDGEERYIERLAKEPTQHNLTSGFFAYHQLAEGVIAEVFSKFTYDSIDRYGDFPGFKLGHEKVRQDEGRHVAFGMEYCRLQYALDPDGATAAILDPALEFKQAIDTLLELAEGSDLEQLALEGYGKTPREIYQAVYNMFLVRLRRINPRVEKAFLFTYHQGAYEA
jgi:hypothetical protein